MHMSMHHTCTSSMDGMVSSASCIMLAVASTGMATEGPYPWNMSLKEPPTGAAPSWCVCTVPTKL
jgi:hypothetical protein